MRTLILSLFLSATVVASGQVPKSIDSSLKNTLKNVSGKFLSDSLKQANSRLKLAPKSSVQDGKKEVPSIQPPAIIMLKNKNAGN